jgi:SH3 domain protein
MLAIRRIRWHLLFIGLWIICGQSSGLAETMYVTDRLYLSLRRAPDAELPAIKLLPSDTKVEILSTQDKWSEVKLEDGSTGWVLKRYLVSDLPKSATIEELRREIENKNALLQKMEQDNGSLKQNTSEQRVQQTREASLRKKISALTAQLAEQKKNVEVNTRQKTLDRLEEVYVTGIVALVVGLIIGYVARRPKKKRQIFY